MRAAGYIPVARMADEVDSARLRGCGPLSADDMVQLAEARLRGRTLTRAARLAAFNGWAVGVVAAISLPFAVFDPLSLVVTAGLGFVAFNEFRGRRLLRRFDARAPRRLALNQLGLLGLIALYGLWQIGAALLGPGPYAETIQAQPELGPMLGSINRLHATASVLIYSCLIVLTCLFQGANAWYYFTRASHLRSFLARTPPWIVTLLRTVAD